MIPMIGTPQGWEWILIFLVIILLFGAAKLPDLARGTGRALRIFKAETKGLRDDEDDSSEDSDTPEDQRSITSGEQHAPAQSADEPAKRHHDS
ncbi:MAG: Sec-independent protein translocase subunit TatA [Actinomycetota bacterium]|nr:Sec-independent protein translocase subunit TatA [Actinomycetota bacterium]